MNQREAIEQEAALWIARQDGQGWTPNDSVDFESWVSQSTAHRVAYLRLRAGWEKLDGLSTRPAEPRPRRWRVAVFSAGLAAAAAILAVVSIPRMRDAAPDTLAYTTEVGGRSTIALGDGSRIELNTNSRLRATVDSEQRTAWLDQGEAYFSIAPDKAHPFVVYSGSRRITVVGTGFSVRKDGPRLTVSVLEGRVRLDAPDGSGAATLLTRGDTAVVLQTSTLVQSLPPEQLADALAWRRDQLRFDNVTLRSAAEEFNRYNRRQIKIADEETAALRIGGSFRATDIDAFARLLENVFGLHVVSSEDAIEVSRRGAAPVKGADEHE